MTGLFIIGGLLLVIGLVCYLQSVKLAFRVINRKSPKDDEPLSYLDVLLNTRQFKTWRVLHKISYQGEDPERANWARHSLRYPKLFFAFFISGMLLLFILASRA